MPVLIAAALGAMASLVASDGQSPVRVDVPVPVSGPVNPARDAHHRPPMRIAVPHHSSKAKARQQVEQRIGQLLSQFSHHADEVQHEWAGDTLRFKGKARGLSVDGTVDVTDTEVIIEAKLPFIAKPFEGRIKQAVEQEAEKMFRGA